jgi:thiol-disulfide isomerase/thioredoxin
MKNIRLILLALILNIQGILAQEVQPLKVGEQVPPMDFLVSYKDGKKINLEQFKNKLVLLDFFYTGCVPCIKAIPKMEALQKMYNDKIQILIVTLDDRQALEKFGRKSAILNKTFLPIIENGKAVQKYFPFQTVPTHVWIDGQGIFRFISDGSNTTKENLDKFFGDEQILLESVQTDITEEKPLWQQISKMKKGSAVLVSSLIKNQYGVFGGSRILIDSATRKKYGFRAINQSPISILTSAFSMENKAFKDPRRIIYQLTDSSKYLPPKDKAFEWSRSHAYCYEINVPLEQTDSLSAFMKQDIFRSFGLRGKIVVLKTKVLVLRIIDYSKLKSNGEKRSFNNNREMGSDFEFINTPFRTVFNSSVGNPVRKYPYPVFDGSGFDGNVDIKINGPINGLENVRKELLNYGITLDEEWRDLEMLVISNKQ